VKVDIRVSACDLCLHQWRTRTVYPCCGCGRPVCLWCSVFCVKCIVCVVPVRLALPVPVPHFMPIDMFAHFHCFACYVPFSETKTNEIQDPPSNLLGLSTFVSNTKQPRSTEQHKDNDKTSAWSLGLRCQTIKHLFSLCCFHSFSFLFGPFSPLGLSCGSSLGKRKIRRVMETARVVFKVQEKVSSSISKEVSAGIWYISQLMKGSQQLLPLLLLSLCPSGNGQRHVETDCLLFLYQQMETQIHNDGERLSWFRLVLFSTILQIIRNNRLVYDGVHDGGKSFFSLWNTAGNDAKLVGVPFLFRTKVVLFLIIPSNLESSLTSSNISSLFIRLKRLNEFFKITKNVSGVVGILKFREKCFVVVCFSKNFSNFAICNYHFLK